MINVKPGYWDFESCSWVGADPAYVVPPLRHAEHAHERDVALPEPRTPRAVEPTELAEA